MLIVETIGRIRREHFVQGKSIKEIARALKLPAYRPISLRRSRSTATDARICMGDRRQGWPDGSLSRSNLCRAHFRHSGRDALGM